MKIEYFDGVGDLVAHRWFDFNLGVLMDISGGGGIEGIAQNLALAIQHNNSKQPDKANAILANVLWNLEAMKGKEMPLGIAHAAMVRAIDGKDVSHLKAEEVEKMLRDKVAVGTMQRLVSALKKKLMPKSK